MNTRGLEDVLGQYTATFEQDYYRRQPLHIAGTGSRFESLLTWDAINHLLTNNVFPYGNVTLVQEGRRLDTKQFVRMLNNRSGPTARAIWKTADVTRALRGGATIILDKIDDYHEPVRLMARTIEDAVGVPVSVNAYAGWRTMRGFDIHTDDHDTFILQVHGRKRWQLFGRADVIPLPRTEAQFTGYSPTPTWSDCLNAGDVLYIPRGWWHVAMPCDEPTVHLTFAIATYTGNDLLLWFVERLKSELLVRDDLPSPGAPHADEYVNALRNIVAGRFGRADTLEAFWHELRAKIEPRGEFTLPWSASTAVLPPGDFEIVSLIRCFGDDVVRTTDEEVQILSRGLCYSFPKIAETAVQIILRTGIMRRAELIDSCCGLYTPDQLDGLLMDLVDHGIVACKSTAAASKSNNLQQEAVAT